MEPLSTDAELLERSASDPGAFGDFFGRHGVAVRRYVVRRVGQNDGEDLAAEVFARAFRSREKFRPEHEDALPWLLGIANRVISEHRRIETRRLATIERLLVENRDSLSAPDVGMTLELVHALRGLPASDRDTLLLLVWGELSRAEVAAALSVPVGTVNSRIARARKRLARELAPSRRSPRTELRIHGDHNA
jgi:RNA polymerase sigma factor (sigma-70 family)